MRLHNGMTSRWSTWAPCLLLGAALLNCGDDDDAGGGAGQGAGGRGGGAMGGQQAGRAGQQTGQAGQASAGGAGSGGTAGQPGAGGPGAGAAGAGGVDCDAQRQQIGALLAAAQVCNVAVDALHCQDVVAGICCDAVIAERDSEAGQAYLAAIAAYKASSCADNCAAALCQSITSGVCTVTGGGTVGVCRPM